MKLYHITDTDNLDYYSSRREDVFKIWRKAKKRGDGNLRDISIMEITAEIGRRMNAAAFASDIPDDMPLHKLFPYVTLVYNGELVEEANLKIDEQINAELRQAGFEVPA